MKALLITREDLRKERKKAMKGENLGWPYLPAIQIIPKKKEKK